MEVPIITNLPAWLQAIAAVATLIVVVYLSRITSQLQRGFIEREETFRVKPILWFTPGRSHVASGDLDPTMQMQVKSIGRGLAFNVNLQIAPTTWVKEDGSGGWKGIHLDLVTNENEFFDTLVKEVDVIHETKGTYELVIQGTMEDENGTTIPIPQIHKSFAGHVEI